MSESEEVMAIIEDFKLVDVTLKQIKNIKDGTSS